MITHDIGNYFWGIDNIKGRMTKKTTTVHESEHPYRFCPSALVVPVFPGKALLTGKWRPKNKTIDEHLLEALRGRNVQEEIIQD